MTRALGRTLTVALVALVAAAAAPAVAAAPAESCAVHDVPPPPAAREEVVPGVVTPAPLPVPTDPVGGTRLGGCGDVLAPGAPAPPAVSAAGWVVADVDTGAVLAAHHPHGRQRPASTLKILTAMVALQRLDLDTVVVGSAEDARIPGSRAGVGPGGRYTVRQLLAGLLLNSGNDAANALARELGGVPATLAAMRDTAAALGALDTRPVTPSGLDGPGMSSSAYDLALLFRVALRDPRFTGLIGTRELDFPGYGHRPGFRLSSDNRLLLRYPGAIGGKNGFTDAARHTFVGAAQRNGRRLVLALVRAEQHPAPVWQQAASLLDHGFALPAGTAPVGTLVDSAPPGTTTTGGDTGGSAVAPPVAVQSDAAATGGASSGSTSVRLFAGIGALGAATALVGTLVGRRRAGR
ncbi:D-alanyl-D-alanine carboxypeptidase family protein [Pseudonocardia sp. H11422]|uniref:D-alanyl-D-alanine carboxypeptidase family protein n=1 Tax=Pseudonocardia sp. H11422 TaxID=2835866 RepID=UPI0027E2B025|nr:D-alanyl-D-alanine carboxypeptidase family protein [Pseudonocardia sp. H11422]